MPVIEELIRTESNGAISFGNYKLTTKTKIQDFKHDGDLYKVKTYDEITKLERNGMFVYESVPGTAVESWQVTNQGVSFLVEGDKDVQLTVQLENDADYEVYVNQVGIGGMSTNMSGKLIVGVELNPGIPVDVKIVKHHS